MVVAGCIAGVSAHVSCGPCICSDSFRLQVLLRSKVGLSGTIVGSFAECRGLCCSMDDGWRIGGRVSKYASATLEGICASSSNRDNDEPVLVRDVE